MLSCSVLQNVANAIGSARRYLESKALAMTEVYATSVIAYALALSGSSVVDEVVTRLEDTAKIAGQFRLQYVLFVGLCFV